jgi:flagellar biosynthesis protein FlhF
VLAALIEADLDGHLAQDIVDRVHSTMPPGNSSPSSVMEMARQEIQSRISTDGGVGRPECSRKIAAFVGPPGAGKTTTIVKLAVRFGIAARRSVHLISTDTLRVGGAEQLRSFAGILGVTFQLADTPAALVQAIDEHRAKDLILIDTPGMTAQDSEHAAILATVLTRRRDIETHLVLQCTTRTADLIRVAQTFSCFAPSKVAFTRLDETEAYGGLLTTAQRLDLPLSFLCAGQRIPEHLEAATPERIASLILHPNPCAARAAA